MGQIGYKKCFLTIGYEKGLVAHVVVYRGLMGTGFVAEISGMKYELQTTVNFRYTSGRKIGYRKGSFSLMIHVALDGTLHTKMIRRNTFSEHIDVFLSPSPKFENSCSTRIVKSCIKEEEYSAQLSLDNVHPFIGIPILGIECRAL